MLPDQDKRQKPRPRWTNANLIGDLGDWGRWREARKLLKANQRATAKGQAESHTKINPPTVYGLRADAKEALYRSGGSIGLAATEVTGTIFGIGTGLYAASKGATVGESIGAGLATMFGAAILAQMGATIATDVQEFIIECDEQAET